MKTQSIVNGVTYTSSGDICIRNGRVLIDGRDVTPDAKNISIIVSGNVSTLSVDACEKIDITGNVGTLKSGSGNVRSGSVSGGIKTESGDVECGAVTGDVSTEAGDVECGAVSGNVKTSSGDVKCESIAGAARTDSGDIRGGNGAISTLRSMLRSF